MKAPCQTPMIDATPTLARQVIEFYADELAEVRFPDLDLAAQIEVARVEAELAEKRAELELRSQALVAKAERALAYARIFAQGDEQLAPRLAEIGRRRSGVSHPHQTASASGTIAAPKRRGRKPKTDEREELFAEPASA